MKLRPMLRARVAPRILSGREERVIPTAKRRAPRAAMAAAI
jgi:hypothetical protein